MSTTLKQCSAAYVILEKLGEKNLDTASLAARLCASYDILSNQSLTYVYGKKAYQLLEDIAPQVHSDAERYQLGQAYSRIGYAILHVDKKYDSKMYAENALTKATGILSSITNQDQKVKQLYTLTMGNVAALAMKNHDYKKALEIHQDNLKLRQDMLGLDATVDNKRLVASSCKGIGTAYFYRAQEDDSRKEEFLSNAYEFHSLSVQHYEELYAPEYDFTIAIADNRKIGTLCQLMEYLDPETQKKRCKEALERMEIAHDYLMQMEPKNEKELQNTRNNIAFLSERLEKLH